MECEQMANAGYSMLKSGDQSGGSLPRISGAPLCKWIGTESSASPHATAKWYSTLCYIWWWHYLFFLLATFMDGHQQYLQQRPLLSQRSFCVGSRCSSPGCSGLLRLALDSHLWCLRAPLGVRHVVHCKTKADNTANRSSCRTCRFGVQLNS